MPRIEEASAGDGVTLRYRVWGDERPDRRIALVHSLAMDGTFWSRVAEQMLPDWEILALDCRGHGGSGKPVGPYTVELFADDLANILDHEGWDRAIVGGASMGGCVALAFAARHSPRVAGLALVDTTAFYGEDAPKAWEERAQKAVDGGMSALVDFQKSRWFSDRFREQETDVVADAVEVFLGNDVQAYVETCRMLGICDMRAAMPDFRFPVEIVVGDEDYATPIPMAQAMHDAIPNSRLTILEGARHFTPLERHEQIAWHLRHLAG